MPNIETIEVHDFIALTIGIIVYFVGVTLTRHISFLRNYNIPEPVTGGLIAALVTCAAFEILDLSITFDLATRDRLLIYFFTAIGLNARFSDLVRGGRALGILLVLTIGCIVIQNAVGLAGTGCRACRFGFADWRSRYGDRLGTRHCRTVRH